MVKNLMVLALLTWVGFSHAKPDSPLSKESLKEAEMYKLEQPLPIQEATRGVAGAKIKKKKNQLKDEESSQKEATETDSEVRYWQYSE
jgi:hypothetical protein